MHLNLTGRNAVVTGGSKGLGFAIAQELLAEGARVAICSRDEKEIMEARDKLQQNGGNVFAQRADVTNPADIRIFVERSLEALGGIDLLVNNAGRAHPGSFEQLTDQDWQEDLDVKLFSMIRCSREVLPHFRSRGGGRIININAIYGKYPDPKFFATSVDRAASQAFTKTLAIEVAEDNILVNSVNIGFVVTPQWQKIRQMRAPDLTDEEFFNQMASEEVPLGRFGQPDEVSGIVVFLASDRASYITGASIDVAGGMGKYL